MGTCPGGQREAPRRLLLGVAFGARDYIYSAKRRPHEPSGRLRASGVVDGKTPGRCLPQVDRGDQ